MSLPDDEYLDAVAPNANAGAERQPGTLAGIAGALVGGALGAMAGPVGAAAGAAAGAQAGSTIGLALASAGLLEAKLGLSYQGALPAKGKEYPGLGYKRLQDKPPKAQRQQQQPAVAQ
ncbi:hypothetical protein V8C86DRAFT_2438039 [Haematococcus lacustris]